MTNRGAALKLRAASQAVAVLGAGEAALALSMRVAQPRLWSEEEPYLYTLLLTLTDAQGDVAQVVGCRVGFREVAIRDGQIHVNGAPILLKGVNRHEHEAETGHTVSTASMV